MHVRVRLFARLRELVGSGELERDVPDGATVETVWASLVRDHSVIAPYAAILSSSVTSFSRNFAELTWKAARSA